MKKQRHVSIIPASQERRAVHGSVGGTASGTRRSAIREGTVVIEAKKDGTQLGREELVAGHVAGLKKACGHWTLVSVRYLGTSGP